MVGQRGPGHLHRLLDLAGRDLPARADQEEEHLEAGQMGEGLERLDVLLAGLELAAEERSSLFHSSICIKLWKVSQGASRRPGR